MIFDKFYREKISAILCAVPNGIADRQGDWWRLTKEPSNVTSQLGHGSVFSFPCLSRAERNGPYDGRIDFWSQTMSANSASASFHTLQPGLRDHRSQNRRRSRGSRS